MKIYLLGKGEEDEASVYGAFSEKEKADKAWDVFSKIEEDLWINDIELDVLEKYYKDVLDGYRWYSFWQHTFKMGSETIYPGWHITKLGLWAHIDEKNYDLVYESESSVWGTVKAKSQGEALDIVNKMHEIAKTREDKFYKVEHED